MLWNCISECEKKNGIDLIVLRVVVCVRVYVRCAGDTCIVQSKLHDSDSLSGKVLHGGSNLSVSQLNN